jgi:hypothetical protein
MGDQHILNADQYRDQWVAFRPNTEEVVAAGATLLVARREAVAHGVEDAEFYHVPASDAYFVGIS